MMKASMRIESPEAVPVTLTLTMPLGAWRQLRAQIEQGPYPSWKLAAVIGEAVRKVDESYSAEVEVLP